MNWYRIAAAATVPIMLAAPIVTFCWVRRRILAATIIGSALFFVTFIFFAAWEFADRLSYAHPLAEPSIFVKIVTYGFVAMVQVMALFLLSQAVEERIRNSEYDPAWR